MLQILIHSSKTMRRAAKNSRPQGTPRFLAEAAKLVDLINSQSDATIADMMSIKSAKLTEVRDIYQAWTDNPNFAIPAIDAFSGDIYSGLKARTWDDNDRQYAHQRLLILSGLYGILRAGDGIMPYRLEMGYKLPDGTSMYEFWGGKLALGIDPKTDLLVDLSAIEYTKALLPHVDLPVVAPRFLTLSPKTSQPTQVVVHTKIARGAMASWLVRERINHEKRLVEFSDLGYRYDAGLSRPDQPVFVAEKFAGIGLSVRLD